MSPGSTEVARLLRGVVTDARRGDAPLALATEVGQVVGVGWWMPPGPQVWSS